MGPLPAGFPVSLRSWPAADKATNNTGIDSIVARINAERANKGGFRALTREGLQREMEEEAAGEEDESEEDEQEAPDRTKEIQTAKVSLIQNIDIMVENARFAQSFATLALTRHNPQVATRSNTVSLLGGQPHPDPMWEHVQKTIPMGTLGLEKMGASLVTDAKKQENRAVARGWKVQNLSKTVDSILAAATRLENEMERETKYWGQVLSIDQEGWAMCRLPNEKHTLGVRFGFTEGARRFKEMSMAALRRGADGEILLVGDLDSEPKSLRVRIQGHDSFASSNTPMLYGDESPIQFRIQQARNTVFATELWQEITREARTLLDFGVTFEDDTIKAPFTDGKSLILDLIPLEDSEPVSRSSDNTLADGLLIGLQLLLSHAHRQAQYRRTRKPAPLKAAQPESPPYSLIRPLLTRLNHQRTVESLHELLIPTIATLKSAGIDASYSHTSRIAPFRAGIAPTERVMLSLTDRLELQTTIRLVPGIALDITSRTDMFLIASTTHTIRLSPPDSPLSTLCPPYPDPLDNWSHVTDYILFAASCALASSIRTSQKRSPFPSQASHSQPSISPVVEDAWQPAVNPNAVVKYDKKTGSERHLSFMFERAGSEIVCRAKWELVGEEDLFEPGGSVGGKGGRGSYEWRSTRVASASDDDEVQVVVRTLTDIAGI